MRVAIVGGGLAGCAAAYVLKDAGAEPVIYEAAGALGTGASGNMRGLYNPRFGAEASPQSEFYALGYLRALEVFAKAPDIGWEPSGCLHLMNDEKKARRFPKTVESWKQFGFDAGDMRLVNADEASEIAGIDIPHDALLLPRGGSVSPRELCQFLSHDIEMHYNVDAVPDGDVVIFAGGAAMRDHDVLQGLDLRAVRGQVSYAAANAQTKALKTHITYGGYVSPAIGGRHVVGSTFQRWLSHDDLLLEDDQDNLAKLRGALPGFEGVEIVDQWAGVRCTSRDHFPVVGHLRDNIYVSSAHGSHGIVSAIMAADILAGMILGLPKKVSDECLAALSPRRLMS